MIVAFPNSLPRQRSRASQSTGHAKKIKEFSACHEVIPAKAASTGRGVDKIEHFKIRAEDKRVHKVNIATGIDGEDLSINQRDCLARHIAVATG